MGFRLLRAVSLVLTFSGLFSFAWSGKCLADTSIRSEIAARPEFAPFLELLATPSYLLVALDNIRGSPLTGGRIVIHDARSFRYRIAEARFVEKRGSVYRYEGKIEWNLAVTKAAMATELQVDTSNLQQGSITISAAFPLASFLPEDLHERVRAKLAFAADLKRQEELIAYLGRLQKRIETATPPKPTLPELILIDAHNQSMALGSSVREPGDAEPLSDQLMLIITLLIWAVAVPATIVLRRRHLARNARRGAP